MGSKYLGELMVDIKDTPFRDYTPGDWALYFIGCYGGIDGDHHKAWTMDQVARLLNGTTVDIKLARWDDGQEEYRVNLNEPAQKYNDWVSEMRDGEDGPYTYGYDEGIAP